MRRILITYLTVCTMISGCNNADVLQAPDITAINNKYKNKDYVIWPNDTIEVKLLYNSELDDEVVVRPDGKISLQPIGDVEVAGLTLKELDDLLTHKYADVINTISEGDKVSIKSKISSNPILSRLHSDEELIDQAIVDNNGNINLKEVGKIRVAGLVPKELREIISKKYSQKADGSQVTVTIDSFKLPEVTVILKSSSAQKVYVGGEVHRQGMIPIAGMLRTMDAVIQAGGPKESAELESVLLIRNNGLSEEMLCTINLKAIMKGKSPDIILQPYDVIFVPRTAIAEVSLLLQQYVHSLIPVQFNFIYNLKPEVEIK